MGVRAGYAIRMPDVTVHRHGDRWAVAEAGAESPVEEHLTREAAELAARRLAAGGAVRVLEDDPTSLEFVRGAGADEPADGAGEPGGPGEALPGAQDEGYIAPAGEGARNRQGGV